MNTNFAVYVVLRDGSEYQLMYHSWLIKATDI